MADVPGVAVADQKRQMRPRGVRVRWKKPTVQLEAVARLETHVFKRSAKLVGGSFQLPLRVINLAVFELSQHVTAQDDQQNDDRDAFERAQVSLPIHAEKWQTLYAGASTVCFRWLTNRFWRATSSAVTSDAERKALKSPPVARADCDLSSGTKTSEYWRWCPQCGHELHNEKCKLRCAHCHYFMSCSDFD